MTQDTVGFIGLGTMGLPMAENLARAGVALAVHDASAEALARAAGLPGATACPSPRGVAARSGVVFTCLPDDRVVEAVYLGPDGVAAGGAAGLVSCDCSTVSAEATRRVARALAERGVTHLDTPMLGSQPQAVSGEIFFIVGGEAAALPRVASYLEIMGRMHMHVGPSGTGNQVKLLHNGLAAVVSVAVAEALGACVAAGVDPRTFDAVVRNGGGMAHGTYFERRVRRVLDGEFTPTFMLALMLKDVGLALAQARGAGAPVPLLEETRRTYEEGARAGWGREDFSAVTRVIERRLGRPLATR
jgi:3-hydroxyisobutyrate dehydrogenase-like beta-hydroxyacid dehydrogenase